MTSDPVVRVRSYRQDDADLTLTVFLNAVQITATANYTPEQIAAWARPNNRNIAEWDQQRRSRETIVAMVGEKVAGFSDLDSSGLIDMMFVDPAYGRRGVASALMREINHLARVRQLTRLYADVSVTARAFFEREGFSVVREQHPVVDGVAMKNFRMERLVE